MRRLVLVLCVVAIGFAATRTAAFPSTIGIYFNLEGYDCDAAIAPQTVFHLYVIAQPGADLPQGIQGAEFRVDGFDLTWVIFVTPNPFASAAIGDPVHQGSNIAFYSCQARDEFGGVLLYTIRVIALQPIAPTVFTVMVHSTPSSPNFQCPLLVNCSAPVFSKYCANGTTACINRAQTCCISAIETSSWGQVKSLYGAAGR